MSILALDLLISRAHLCHAECTGANRSPVCFTSSMLHPCLNAAYLNSVSQQALEEPKIKGICILAIVVGTLPSYGTAQAPCD